MRTDTMLEDRQVGIVDARGNAASFSGRTTFDWSGGRVGSAGRKGSVPGGKGDVIAGRTYSAQANIMVSDQTVKNLAATFERSPAGSSPTGSSPRSRPARPAAATSAACSPPRCSW